MAASATATGGKSSQTAELSQARRYAVLVTVVLSASLYGTTILIVSTILPQLQGAFSATADEISWAMTFNILATAVATPTTGWLVARLGRKYTIVGSASLFTFATWMCGTADSLEALIFWRIVQGAGGAPMTPLAQTIILDIFPKKHHGLVVGLYGIGVMVGSMIGPILGGLMADLGSWRWAFYLIVPMGIVASVGMSLALPRSRRARHAHLDWTGFLLLSAGIAGLQLMLSRGQRLDWFDSTEILIEAIVAATAFYMFVVHSLTARHPFLHLKLLLNRNFSIGLALVTLYGMLNFTPMVLLPPLLRQHLGFPDALIGLVTGFRGIGALMGFFLAMFIGQRFPRKSLMVGYALQAFAGAWLMSMDLNMNVNDLYINAAIQGLAIGLIWVPLTVVTFSTMPSKHLAEATSVFHLLRNIGSSIFISVCVTEIVRSSAMNYEHMTEMISPFNGALSLPFVMGEWHMDSVEGLARLSREMARQAAMIGYLNAFGLYTLACALAMPLIFFVARAKKAKAPEEAAAG